MKRSFSKATFLALLCSYPHICSAQQADPDGDGALNPTPDAPAFGAAIDYASDEFMISGWSKADYADYPQITDLPTIYLTYSATIDFGSYTPSEVYNEATIVIVDKHGTMKQRNEATTFRGRGNSTWRNGTDKKPWRLKFPTKTKLLAQWDMTSGCEVNNHADAKSWTLLSNPFDKSMIRNAVTHELGQLIGLPFCPAYRFVDLVMNGEYFGTYQVSDHMEVAQNRVWAGSKADWFLELCDSMYGEDPQFYANGAHFNVKNPDDDPVALAAMQSYMNNTINAIKSKNGLSQYIDLQSLADFMIGMDMTSNFDGIKGNGYCYKGVGEADKLQFGPLWDLDLGYGNVGGWASAKDVDTKHFWQVQSGYADWFYMNIYESKEFQMYFYPRWKAVYQDKLAEKLIAKVDEIYSLVQASALLNYTKGGHGDQKWTMAQNNMGLTYQGSDIAACYQQACADIKAFITSHVSWLNKQYAADYRRITELDPDTAVEPTPEPPTGGDGDGGGDGGDPDDGPTAGGTTADPGLANYPDAEWESWGGTLYTYTGSAKSIKEGTKIEIVTTQSNTDLYYGAAHNDQWLDGSSCSPIPSIITLTAEQATKLAQNGYTFLIVVWDRGECTGVTVTPPDADDDTPTEPALPELTIYSSDGTQTTISAESWSPSADDPNQLAVVDASTGLSGKNIVVRQADGTYTCQEFELTDGYPLNIPFKFTTTQAIYQRATAGNQWGTLCLPFKVVSDDNVTLYTLAGADIAGDDEGTLTFTETSSTGGLTPLLFRKRNADADVITFTAGTQADGSITVKATKPIDKNITTAPVAGWAMLGNVTSQATAVSTDDRDVYFIAGDKFWHATGNVTIPAFRAIFTATPSAPAAASMRIAVSDATGIDCIGPDGSAAATIHDMSGRPVPASRTLPAGMYVIGGQKVWVKP